jgi:hypothetical protein
LSRIKRANNVLWNTSATRPFGFRLDDDSLALQLDESEKKFSESQQMCFDSETLSNGRHSAFNDLYQPLLAPFATHTWLLLPMQWKKVVLKSPA